MVLLEWDGTYDLEIITDATYTVNGMDFERRASNLKGADKELWKLIYDEFYYTAGSGDLICKSDTGCLTITKIKSHSEGKHLYCRQTPSGKLELTT